MVIWMYGLWKITKLWGWILYGWDFCCLIAQSCLTLAIPWIVARQAPLSMGFSRQEDEWVAISFSRGSSRPRDQTCVSCIGRRILDHWATWKTNRWDYCPFKGDSREYSYPLSNVWGQRKDSLLQTRKQALTNLNLPAPLSQTPQTQELRNVCCLCHPVYGIFVKATQTEKDRALGNSQCRADGWEVSSNVMGVGR